MSERLTNPELPPISSLPSSGISATKWVETYGLGNRETVRRMLETYETARGVSLSPSVGSGRLIDPTLSALLLEVFTQAKREGVKPEVLWVQRLEQSQAPKDEMAVAARAGAEQYRAELVGATRTLFAGLAEEYGRRVEGEVARLGEQAQQRLFTLEEGRGKQLETLDKLFNQRLKALEEEHKKGFRAVLSLREEQVENLRGATQQLNTLFELSEDLEQKWDKFAWATEAVNTRQGQLEKMLELGLDQAQMGERVSQRQLNEAKALRIAATQERRYGPTDVVSPGVQREPGSPGNDTRSSFSHPGLGEFENMARARALMGVSGTRAEAHGVGRWTWVGCCNT